MPPAAALGAAHASPVPGAHEPAPNALEPPRGPLPPPFLPEPPTAAVAVHLTPRERAVMDRVSHGRTNMEIAADLNLAFSQVRSTLARLFRKLGVSDRAELAAAGFVNGLLVAESADDPPPLPPHLAPFLAPVAAGETDEAIADFRRSRGLPSCTPPAVRNRMREIRRVLGAASREHVVRLAVEAGLLVVSADGTRLVLADGVSS